MHRHTDWRIAPWAVVSIVIAVIGYAMFFLTWGLSSVLGVLGAPFAIPGLWSTSRSRTLAGLAVVLNAGLVAIFTYLMITYDVFG